jgi:SAM-dependent methyltransferase
VNERGIEDIRHFFASKMAHRQMEARRIVRTRFLDRAERDELLCDPELRKIFAAIGATEILEHERVPFASFPYEWSPRMLQAAGELTLTLAREGLDENVGLKDATPLNVLFRGPEAVFIDLLSFEARDPRDPTWLPYAQFVRTFLLPLLANRHFGTTLAQVLLGRRDGLEPEEVYGWLGLLGRLRPGFLTHVSIPVWLGARHNSDDTSIYKKKALGDPEKARYILDGLLARLLKSLKHAGPDQKRQSVWSDYMSSNNNYSREQFEAKKAFVGEALREFSPAAVLDVGCNTGEFSALSAQAGASVVAIDYDPVVVDEVWSRAHAEKLQILPLVCDLTRPTPATGWMNREWPSFLERASGRFDCVLMLAVIHHMLVTERVPLIEIVNLAARLTRRFWIVEFVEPGDSMFRRLARGRDELHRDLTVPYFEETCRTRFRIVRSVKLPGTHRSLYLLERINT